LKTDCTKTRDELEAILRQYLSGTRLEHSLMAEQTAVELAEKYGADVEKARVAGLMHDITKHMDNEALAEKYNIRSLSVKTLHGPTGAAFLEENGIICDPEILEAVRYHTTGRENMTMLEKIIYMADYIEPMRDFEEVGKLRRLADEDIDKAVLYGLELTLEDLLQRKILIEIDSVKAYNFYRKKYFGEDI
jgi:predicted HD superfamily hydrolase involved in NAD metabolism